MIRVTALIALTAALLVTAAPTTVHACKFAIAEVEFAEGSTVLPAEGEAELVRWAGIGGTGEGRGARVNVVVDPGDPTAAALQRARGKVVADRLIGLGFRREDIQFAVRAVPGDFSFITVYPDPPPCTDL